jgi:hypothetical protein
MYMKEGVLCTLSGEQLKAAEAHNLAASGSAKSTKAAGVKAKGKSKKA